MRNGERRTAGRGGAEGGASNSTAKNDQKTESTLARFVGRFEILASEKGFSPLSVAAVDDVVAPSIENGCEKEPTGAFRSFFEEKIE